MNNGICPKCNKTITYVNIQSLDAVFGMNRYKSVSYLCPLCRTILSVQMDPIALKSSTVAAIKKKL